MVYGPYINKANHIWTVLIKLVFANIIMSSSMPAIWFMKCYAGSAPYWFKPLHYFYIIDVIALLEVFVLSTVLILHGFHLRFIPTYMIFFDFMHYLLLVQGIIVIALSEWIDDIFGQVFFSTCVGIYGLLAILDLCMLKLNPWLQNSEYRERQKRIQQRTAIETYDGTGSEQCNICLNNFAIGDEIQVNPCEHRYHKECLTTWLNIASTCPNCRVELLNIQDSDNSSSIEDEEEEEGLGDEEEEIGQELV